jgi:hypothetical protein
MPAIAFAYPVLPGKFDAWKRFMQEMAGPRRSELEASRRRMGFTVERAWYQATPQGDIAIIYAEVDDLVHTSQTLAASQDPFDVWFKQQVLDIHGVDYNQPPPGSLPELLFEWKRGEVV